MAKRDIVQEFADKIIADMENLGTDWMKPWAESIANSWPTNAVTENRYQGNNVLLLGMASACKGYRTNLWAGYGQWQEIGAQVRKGEKSTKIVFFNYREVTEKDKNGDTAMVFDSEVGWTEKKKLVPRTTVLTVFNADQVDGYTLPETATREHTPHDAAEAWIAATGAKVETGADSAYYIPSADTIRVPDASAFYHGEGYYATIFHELTHWTGSKNRLDRLRSTRFGSSEYALEELVAEIGAAFQCALTGVTMEPRPDHAKYLNCWMTALKNDKRAITTAMSAAQKAVDYLSDLQ